MEGSLLSILFLGFILGIKHAIEPDHVIAVSTIASQSKKLWRSSLAGVFWGIGHTATLFLVGIILIIMKGNIPEEWAMSFEFLVGIMLVYLGIASILSFKKVHHHEHQHNEVVHDHFHHRAEGAPHLHEHKKISYRKSLLIGLVHGLGGSAAMVLLTMSSVTSVWEGAVYILIFGLGTTIGMLGFTTIIGIPFVLSAKKESVNLKLTRITGLISTAFGLYYMYNLGVTEGLFKIWMQ
ncbi:ABC-type nickel/cobalt efflux system permease component RcnA [Neobacillus bataviensis]|uniref:ABC-type nickel/cobalt efflux system permease component RcnA n=1 Tax=Neobacillus bataviensis TaxID=220685 RepID=A0A561CWY9_9BACI|nr:MULTISPECIES: sulfite exporter TauE/SafE family protein [Bacillaceae]PFN99402.1 urease accessory protein UreH [Bacillus sp. AFS076308]PGV55796.1 urease accessory protein UreH [Bacillus sp. AFS037270]TWD95753.1 ABC-type nickel/cobalt efflux system permease component RcnA [Neobacillus bataviensis]